MRNIFRELAIFAGVGVAAIVVPGCGQPTSGPQLAPVSGVVTFGGKPAAHVYVRFKPIASGDTVNTGAASEGFADEQGRYSLYVMVGNQKPGAVVGAHRVSIHGTESRRMVWQWGPVDAGPPDQEVGVATRPMPDIKIPKDFEPLRFEVPPGGTDTANFSL